ncbi:MAG: glycosyltransferase family 4 protein [Endomicrobiia bacterium]
MNIALFDASKYWSGGAQRVYLCCKGFKEKGHNVILICFATNRLNVLLKNHIKIFNIRPVFDLDILAAIKILFILIKYKIDIIDIHSPKFYWIGLITGKILKKKVFITRNVEYRKKGIKKIINRFLYRNCNGVIAVSNKIKENLIKDFNLYNDKVNLIYDGFNLKQGDFNIRKNYNISEDEIVISIIGRIEKNKAQDFAVEVAYELVKNNLKVKLLIIGKIEDHLFYKKIIEKINTLKISENVIFTGFVKNTADYIFSSDVILCCSYYEGLPRSLVESIILSKPVVCSSAVDINDLEEFKEIIKIVKERNPKKFAKAILELLSYKKAKINPDILQEKFSIESMIKKYLKFYSE